MNLLMGFEVIVGLSLIWFLLSTFVMHVQEWLAAVLRLRSRALEKTIFHMLKEKSFTNMFYEHPVIRSLGGDSGEGIFRKPSYIPAEQFASVLYSMVSGSSSESQIMLEGLYKVRENALSIRKKRLRENAIFELNRLIDMARIAGANRQSGSLDGLLVSTIHREIEALEVRFDLLRLPIQEMLNNTSALLERMNRLSVSPSPSMSAVTDEYERFSAGMVALSVTNPSLKTTLDSLLVELNFPENQNKVFDKFVAHIGGWFNGVMNRLTGIYKRKIQIMTFFIALLSAYFLNIDSIKIMHVLWQNSIEREVLSLEAERLIVGYLNEPDTEMSKEESLRLLGEYSVNFGLPIGWFGSWKTGDCISDEASSFVPGIKIFGYCYILEELEDAPSAYSWLLLKFAGFLITAIASTQGSSFWFDILTRFVNVRSSGAVPG